MANLQEILRNTVTFEFKHLLKEAKGDIEMQHQNILNIIKSLYRPLLRGAMIGGVAGGIYAFVAGENYGEYIKTGSILGAKIDFLQHSARGCISFFYYA